MDPQAFNRRAPPEACTDPSARAVLKAYTSHRIGDWSKRLRLPPSSVKAAVGKTAARETFHETMVGTRRGGNGEKIKPDRAKDRRPRT